MGTNTDWESALLLALEANKMRESLDILNALKTPHRNTPNSAVKSRAIEIIVSFLRDDKKAIFEFASQYIKQNDVTALEISAHLLAHTYSACPKETTELLLQLADHEDWEVREWTAGACGRILSEYFDSFYPEMKKWAAADSYKIRRAVAVAVKHAARTKREDYAEPLLDLVEDLLSDPHPYVKNNLGPFAIGDGLLRYYPEQVLKRIDQWVQWESEHARWNVAKIFSAAEAVKHLDKAKTILSCLAEDESHLVRRAVKSSRNQLEKRIPSPPYGDGP